MKFIATILLIALVSAASAKVSSIQPVLAQANFDNSLVNYLLQPSASAADAFDPTLSAQCFNYYLPILTEVANTYSVEYQACLTLANEQMTNLTDQAMQDRTTYVEEASDICTAYQGCNDMTDNLNFFNCYATVSNEEVTQVYAISNQAVSSATTLSQGMKQIQDNEDICANATQVTYVENTAQTYQQLDTCLQVGLPVAVTTEAAAVPTDAPVQSTVGPTDAPVQSTDSTVGPTDAPVQTTEAIVDNGNDNSAQNAAFAIPAMAQSGVASQAAPLTAAKAVKFLTRRNAHKSRN